MKKAKQILSLVLALLMVIGIPVSVSAAENFELLSVTVKNDYQLLLRFNAEVEERVSSRSEVLFGIAWVPDGHEGLEGWSTLAVETIEGTVVRGADTSTVIWTMTSPTSTIKQLLSETKLGYTRMFYLRDLNCGWSGGGHIGAMLSAAGKALSIPEKYTNTANTTNEYMFMDITPADELELVSIEPVDEYSLKVRFNKAVTFDGTVNPKANPSANLRLINPDGSWYYYDIKNSSGIDQTVDYGYSLGNNMQPTDDPAVWMWTMPAEYTGIGSLDMETNKVRENNKSINYVLDTWANKIAAGYKATFMLIDGADDGALDVNNPATYPGYSKRVMAVDGGYLKTTHRTAGGNDYVFKEISKIETDLELESVTQIAPYSLELKFTQDLNTTDVSGTPWIVNMINNTTNVKIGMAWVSNACTGQEAFGSVTSELIEGTVALGETADTLIWTVDDRIAANLIPTLVNATKEGYTRKFFLYDNGCGWYGEGGSIGAIQSAGNKPLLIPESNKHASTTSEYLFADIVVDNRLQIASVAEIGDYQLELQFTQKLRDNVLTLINNNQNAHLGIAKIKDGHTGAEDIEVVRKDVFGGTVEFGKTDNTLIWTVGDQTKTISERLNDKEDGYTWKFYFYDGNCNYHGAGFIGGVQGVHPTTGAAIALSVPDAYKKTADGGIKEYVFADIDSYLDREPSTVIELQENKSYHFMNADTGRSLVVDGAEEFTIVRKSGNVISLMVGDKYVDLHSTPAQLSDTAYNYLLEACEHGRYRILVSPIVALSDNDAGTDNVASLAPTYVDLEPISTGWYLTASGENRPLRILPIGDSITYGSVAEGETYNHGWRDTLSEDLMGQFGRVVFVGSQTSKITTVDEKELYRHEGNPGWTVSHMAASLNDIATGVVDKYDPDVVLLMAGINDMSNFHHNEYSDQQALDALKTNYTDLVEKLAANMEGDDVIFCSTLTPIGIENWLAEDARMVNAAFPSWVKEWAAEGLPVALNDNYTDLKDVDGVQCSDNLHLSSVGDALVAEQYAKSILNYYNTDGSEKDLQEKIAAAVEDGQTELYLNEDVTIHELNVPDTITLDLNGHTLTASYVVAYGDIKDSTEGNGGIAIAKNDTNDDTHSLVLPIGNAMMALYEEDFGYRFFTCTTTQLFNEGTPRFGFQIDINEKGLALLKDAANADVEVMTKLIVTIDGEQKLEKDYVFQAATVADYATKKANDPASNWAIILTVTGFEKLSGTDIRMTSTPIFKSSTGVGVAPATDDATVTYTYNK